MRKINDEMKLSFCLAHPDTYLTSCSGVYHYTLSPFILCTCIFEDPHPPANNSSFLSTRAPDESAEPILLNPVPHWKPVAPPSYCHIRILPPRDGRFFGVRGGKAGRVCRQSGLLIGPLHATETSCPPLEDFVNEMGALVHTGMWNFRFLRCFFFLVPPPPSLPQKCSHPGSSRPSAAPRWPTLMRLLL